MQPGQSPRDAERGDVAHVSFGQLGQPSQRDEQFGAWGLHLQLPAVRCAAGVGDVEAGDLLGQKVETVGFGCVDDPGGALAAMPR